MKPVLVLQVLHYIKLFNNSSVSILHSYIYRYRQTDDRQIDNSGSTPFSKGIIVNGDCQVTVTLHSIKILEVRGRNNLCLTNMKHDSSEMEVL